MANAKCRSCDHAADAGAYCSSCAADIMAKALNPFFGGGEKSSPGRLHVARPQSDQAAGSGALPGPRSR